MRVTVDEREPLEVEIDGQVLRVRYFDELSVDDAYLHDSIDVSLTGKIEERKSATYRRMAILIPGLTEAQFGKLSLQKINAITKAVMSPFASDAAQPDAASKTTGAASSS